MTCCRTSLRIEGRHQRGKEGGGGGRYPPGRGWYILNCPVEASRGRQAQGTTG